MEKGKRINKNSVRWKMVPYLLVMAVALLLGYAVLGLTANMIQDQLILNFAEIDEKIYYEKLYTRTGENVTLSSMASIYDWEDGFYEELFQVASIGQVVLGIPWTIACLLIPGTLFYRRHLKKPLQLLINGAQQIGENNLDFSLYYEETDEMGQLCNAFEKMRLSLQENNLQMWRQIEERKRLNAAFAHDLRTPLTVLKGQADMLLRFVPEQKMPEEKIVAAAATMKRHIGRLEEYVQTMNHLQRLEDIEVRKEEISADEFVMRLLESGQAICGESAEFQLDASHMKGSKQLLDMQVAMRVCDNLISNAARYAARRVTAVLSDENGFSVTVTDDGAGFSKEALERAANPFYRAKQSSGKDEKEASVNKPAETSGHKGEKEMTEHMGMGLYICKVLCEKHGGYLHLSNGKKGARVRAGF